MPPHAHDTTKLQLHDFPARETQLPSLVWPLLAPDNQALWPFAEADNNSAPGFLHGTLAQTTQWLPRHCRQRLQCETSKARYPQPAGFAAGSSAALKGVDVKEGSYSLRLIVSLTFAHYTHHGSLNLYGAVTNV